MSTTRPDLLIDEAEEAQLDATWRPPSGFIGWFTAVNHRAIGIRFIVTAFVFFLLGGVLALMMRTQLMRPDSTLINPDLYNQIFTMHGITMMFLFAVPMAEGIVMYLLPLMVGTRDAAFPRMNAFGYYVFLVGGLVLYIAFFLNLAPDAGWFAYPPLSDVPYSPGMRMDFYTTLITFVEVSALVAAVEIIVTVLRQRAPGMSLDRIPLFVWAGLVTAFMIVFAMPGVIAGSVMLALDRMLDAQFFKPGGGGDPLLWQHLFWWFGHPEVYIILIPGLGIVSSIVTTFARRPIFGYTAIVISLIAIGLISFGLWVHHMFVAGVPELGSSFFTAASMLIAIPSGVQIFCWIATLWGGRPVFRTPLLFVIGFIILFVMGGLTGVMVASVQFDAQVHDTYFVVAHFHYVLIGGMVFPLFGGFYYWFPKFTGRMLSERMGVWNFLTMFIGFNLTFFPQHELGFIGMPRRVYTYLDGLGWNDLNLLSTIGSYILALGGLLFVINVIRSLRGGEPAGPNPWGADTLEWYAESPPASYNFRHIPVVEGRYPLWDRADPDVQPVVTGVRSDRREVVITTLLDAHVENVSVVPRPSILPLLMTLTTAVAFVGVIWSTWLFMAGALLSFFVLAAWHWPSQDERTPPWKGGPDE